MRRGNSREGWGGGRGQRSTARRHPASPTSGGRAGRRARARARLAAGGTARERRRTRPQAAAVRLGGLAAVLGGRRCPAGGWSRPSACEGTGRACDGLRVVPALERELHELLVRGVPDRAHAGVDVDDLDVVADKHHVVDLRARASAPDGAREGRAEGPRTLQSLQ